MSAVPVRRAAAEIVDADLLLSACTVDDVATPNRNDPYWDQLWAPGSQALWSTGRMARSRRSLGLGRVRVRELLARDEALRMLTSGRGRAERLAGWAVMDSWRTVTAEQLAAFTGSVHFLDPDYSAIRASFALDLVDVGRFASPVNWNQGTNRHGLYRPSGSDTFDDVIAPTLTWPEWASVTGGMPWTAGGQYDRHNVLAAELALRAAEYLPVGTVLGEKFATVDLLCGTGLGRTVTTADTRRADGVIVRPDGMRIAYELTASASRSFQGKVRRWAKLISERSLETSGLTVLFIAAPHPDRAEAGRDPRREIYKAIAEVLKEFPGTGPDSPAARIGVADWADYFPDRHQLSEAFFGLSADFALGASGNRWVRRNLLTGYDFEPWHTFDATAVIENAPLLAATPHWLRRGDHTHLIGTPVSRAGAEVPHPSPVRPDTAAGLDLGAPKGSAGAAKLPERLRITGF